MKLLRYGIKGVEKPGLLDSEDRIRDLSGVVADITAEILSSSALSRLRTLDVAEFQDWENNRRRYLLGTAHSSTEEAYATLSEEREPVCDPAVRGFVGGSKAYTAAVRSLSILRGSITMNTLDLMLKRNKGICGSASRVSHKNRSISIWKRASRTAS